MRGGTRVSRAAARAAVSAFTAVASVACLDLSVPKEVTIRCDPDDDATCPDGTKCQPGLLVCVEEGKLDTAAPAFELTAEPATASRAQPFRVRAVASEALPEPPTAVLLLGDGERALDLQSNDSNPEANDYRFEYEADGNEPEGEDVVVRVRGVDRVGLVGEGEVVMRFDFTPPAAPPTDSRTDPLGAVLIITAPGGTSADATEVWQLEAPVGSMEEGGTLALRTSSSTAPFDVANARVDGSARANLPSGLTEVWVSHRDAAGNESAIVRVRELQLTMTTSPAEPSSPKLTGELAAVADDGPLSPGRMGVPYVGAELRGPMTATRLDRDTPMLMSPALVYDHARSQLWMFGGEPATDAEPGTAFSWTGSAWAPRAVGAPARSGHTLAYNPTDGSIAFIGGSTVYYAQEGRPELWRFDGQSFAREPDVRASLGSTAYELRCKRGAAFFDPARPNVLVIHGCPVYSSAEVDYAQWERDVQGEWSLVGSPPDPEGDGNPRALAQTCSAVDFARGRVLMFGGRNAYVEPQVLGGETWQWDGDGWELLAAEDPSNTSAPAPRYGASCAWDPKTGRTYLLGGWVQGGNIAALRELWAHDDTGWTRLPDAPHALQYGADIAVDARRGEVIVYGAPYYPPAPLPTLVFDGAQWRTLEPRAVTPAARSGASLVAVDGALVLQGEDSDDPALWRFDDAWHRIGPLAGSDQRTDAAALARNGELLLLGGQSVDAAQVWRVDLASATPAQDPLATSVAALLPPNKTAWTGFSHAVDPNTGIVAAGGGAIYTGFNQYVEETAVWFLDGVTWTRGPELSLPGEDMRQTVMTYDVAAGGFLLYGNVRDGGERATYTLPFSGIGSLSGASWQRMSPDAERPSGADGAVLVYDETLAAPLLVGGSTFESDDGATDEAYVFRQDHWVTAPIVDVEGDGALPALIGAAGAYHTSRGRTVMFGGGNGGFSSTSRTYALDALANERPALVVALDPSAVGIDGVEALLSLTLDATAGATASGVDGYAVRVWDGAAWVEVGSEATPASAPGDVTLSVPADGALSRAILGARVPVQLVPLAENGADRARIVAPRVEMTARFRLR